MMILYFDSHADSMECMVRHRLGISHSEWCGCLSAWENKFNRCSIFIAFLGIWWCACVCVSFCFWFDFISISLLWQRKTQVSRATQSMNQWTNERDWYTHIHSLAHILRLLMWMLNEMKNEQAKKTIQKNERTINKSSCRLLNSIFQMHDIVIMGRINLHSHRHTHAHCNSLSKHCTIFHPNEIYNLLFSPNTHTNTITHRRFDGYQTQMKIAWRKSSHVIVVWWRDAHCNKSVLCVNVYRKPFFFKTEIYVTTWKCVRAARVWFQIEF